MILRIGMRDCALLKAICIDDSTVVEQTRLSSLGCCGEPICPPFTQHLRQPNPDNAQPGPLFDDDLAPKVAILCQDNGLLIATFGLKLSTAVWRNRLLLSRIAFAAPCRSPVGAHTPRKDKTNDDDHGQATRA